MEIKYLLGINVINTIREELLKFEDQVNNNYNYYDSGIIIIISYESDQMLCFNCDSIQSFCFQFINYFQTYDINGLVSDNEHYNLRISDHGDSIEIREEWNIQNNNVTICINKEEIKKNLAILYERINTELLREIPQLSKNLDFNWHLQSYKKLCHLS